jgi:Flp pilus assembly protein TadG
MAPDERGQVVPLAAVLLVVAGVLALGLVRVARTAAGMAAAQSAADAAALAAVSGGEAVAIEVAGANEAQVTSYTETGEVVTVTVRRGCCSATASARWVADPVGPGGPAP